MENLHVGLFLFKQQQRNPRKEHVEISKVAKCDSEMLKSVRNSYRPAQKLQYIIALTLGNCCHSCVENNICKNAM